MPDRKRCCEGKERCIAVSLSRCSLFAVLDRRGRGDTFWARYIENVNHAYIKHATCAQVLWVPFTTAPPKWGGARGAREKLPKKGVFVRMCMPTNTNNK